MTPFPSVVHRSGIAAPPERYPRGNSVIDARATGVDSRGVVIAVLGPITIDGEDGRGARDRVVLQALVVKAGEVVDKQVLADALWGDSLPASWSKMVQGCIVRLRRQLPPGTIETTPYGYRLVVHEDELDTRLFERLLGRARDHLRDDDPDRAAFVVGEALSLWRGRPLPDLDEWEPGRAEAARLAGLHLDAEELRLEAEIAAGRSRAVAEEARALTQGGAVPRTTVGAAGPGPVPVGAPDRGARGAAPCRTCSATSSAWTRVRS